MMVPAKSLNETAAELTSRLLEGSVSTAKLEAALRLLCKWRAQVLEGTLIKQSGETILAGPFKGMHYPVRSAEGSRSSRLLGTYEAGLTAVVQAIIETPYDLILNIGCAEGYYAVGLALRCPAAQVIARDTDPRAQEMCRLLADANDVANRIMIGGEVGHDALAMCKGCQSVILCDIEGAEDHLLDPILAPALFDTDILVEVHEATRPGLMDRLTARFQKTHKITRLGRSFSSDALPDWSEKLSDIDRFLLLWEWRSGPTPWLWMERT